MYIDCASIPLRIMTDTTWLLLCILLVATHLPYGVVFLLINELLDAYFLFVFERIV